VKFDFRLGRLIAFAALAALTACGEAKKQPGQATAGGEVLEGSVSDAMLPVDRVRSQPPLAPKSEGSGKAEGDKPDGGRKRADPVREGAATEPAPAAQAADAGVAPSESRPDEE
jgi:hypothetical protein